jgi:hypothetical protein
MPMYGYALALFARERGEESPAWAKLLRPDVRQAFEQGCRFLASDEGDRPGPDAAGSLPIGRPGADASGGPDEKAEQGPESDEDADDYPRCTFCGAVLDEATSPELVCAECRQSMAANERALQAARDQEEADYQAKARVARPTCLVMVVGCAAVVLWQLIRATMK